MMFFCLVVMKNTKKIELQQNNVEVHILNVSLFWELNRIIRTGGEKT